MSISDHINRIKSEFFTKKDITGLTEQHNALEVTLREIREREALRKQVLRQQQELHQLRSAPSREKLQSVTGGLEKLKSMSAKANTFFVGENAPGLIAAAQRREQLLKPRGGIFKEEQP